MKFYIVSIAKYHSLSSYYKRNERFKLFRLIEDANKYIANRIFDELSVVPFDTIHSELAEYYIDGQLNEIYRDDIVRITDIRNDFDELKMKCYIIWGKIDTCNTDDIQ
jgi:hypothetical protein